MTLQAKDCVIEITQKLNDRVSLPQHSIFEVPSCLQKLEPEAFIPHIVSIGPYHRNQKHLQEMEKQKWRLLRHVLETTKCPLKVLTGAMSKLENETRKCYDKTFEAMTRLDFIEMMLLDACFIVELFSVVEYGREHCGYALDDPLFTKWAISPFIQRDLLMLENQLPLFVLDQFFRVSRFFPARKSPLLSNLLRLTITSFGDQQKISFRPHHRLQHARLPTQHASIEKLALKFFDIVLPGLSQNLPKSGRNEKQSQAHRLHLLDVVRQALRPLSQANCEEKQDGLHAYDLAQPQSSMFMVPSHQGFQKEMHSVITLRDTGVEFKKKESTNFTNIEFNEVKGVLYIPPLVIHESTNSIFLNLMVFEQFYTQFSINYVTSYVRFMFGLINSSEDVEYLYNKRIVQHGLTSNNDVARLFNNLCKYIVNQTNDSNLAKISHYLNKHFNTHVRPEVTLSDYLIQIEKKPFPEERIEGPEEGIENPEEGIENPEEGIQNPEEGFESCSIFEVPSRIRRLEPDAFIPHVVSIGPYHRHEKRLQQMEKHKRRLLQRFLYRTNTLKAHMFLMEKMFELEIETRNFYEKPFKNFSSQEFVEMMLLDACFILELLNEAANEYQSKDPLWTRRGISPFIQRDLLMLENQLPLSVLNKLFELTKGDGSVDELSLKFFDSVLPTLSKYGRKDQQPCFHLLDVVRRALRPSCMCLTSQEDRPNVQGNSPFQTTMHSVTRLRGTSVEFKQKDEAKFTDIEYSERVLSIPPLVIHDSTKSIFLNLMVFEQYYPQCDNYITSYISFMDGLINSAKDVEYLCEKGIINHDLGSDEDVAGLFNNLRKEIGFHANDSYLAKVSQDLNKNFKEKWGSWKATLKHEYLKDPWKVISLVAATFLIFFTIAQTAYTIVAYHHPSP